MKRIRKNLTVRSKNYEIGSFSWKYARMLEERRGHNYQYLNNELFEKLQSKGYNFFIFKDKKDVTISELEAEEIVKMLRETGYYARIVAGHEKNIQRIKMFSVIYKKRDKKWD